MATINGTNASETIVGTDGDDIITGSGGNDTIYAYQGDGTSGVGGTAPTTDPDGGDPGATDEIRGGSGDDTLYAGEGTVAFQYSGTSNGYDTFVQGSGTSTAVTTSNNTSIGVKGDYANDVDGFDGDGHTNVTIQGDNSASTLDFSATTLTDIQEVDANDGNDTIIASDLTAGAYRGGSGDDTLQASSQTVDWLYSGTSNGYDTFIPGSGTATARATSNNTAIGIKGDYNNELDGFNGDGHTNVTVQGENSASTLDFSATTLTDIQEVDANGGDDTIIASDLSAGAYRGGSGDDTLQASSQTVDWLYSGTSNGYDTFIPGSGTATARATSNNTAIGVKGSYNNELDGFNGDGHTNVTVQGDNSSKTFDFSATTLTDIQEVDANGGDDTIIASDLTGGAYRGGAGNDLLQAGTQTVDWLYSGTSNGYDTFTQGAGTSTARATSSNTSIGLKKAFANDVDAFDGAGYSNVTVQGDGTGGTMDFSATTITDIKEIDVNGGHDHVIASGLSDAAYRGGAGNDLLEASSRTVDWLYSGTSNGYDSFIQGTGTSTAKATSNNTAIGVKKDYVNGVDGFDGDGYSNVTVQADNASGLLDFSATTFSGIVEVDANGGHDHIIASDLTAGAYRGGAGNDLLDASSQDVDWVYSGTSNGYDRFTQGTGTSTAKATSNNTAIGVMKDFVNHVDGFDGNGYSNVSVQGDNASGRIDVSQTTLTDIAVIDSNDGNDDVTTAQTALVNGPVLYDGGNGTDILRVTLSVSQIGNAGVQADLAAYDAAPHNTPYTFTTLGNMQAVHFEQLETALAIDGAVIALDACDYQNVIIGTYHSEPLVGTAMNDLIIGLDGNDTITGGDGMDCIIAGGGNDIVDGGEGSDHFFVIGAGHGYDTYNDTGTVGFDTAVAITDGTVFGVNGYDNGIDKFTGRSNADVVIRDTYQSHTLNFATTQLVDIVEVDAGDGNDVITTSDQNADIHYRGNKGDDTFHTGSTDVTLLYDGTSNGYDTFATNGSGTSVALAESDGTVIGVNGFANGVEEISGGGFADVVVRDTYQSHTLDFSNTLLTGIAEVDAGDGNDAITTSELTANQVYRGNKGDDTFHTGSTDVTLLYDGTSNGYDSFATNGSGNSVALAESDGTVIGVNGFANGVEEISGGGFADVVVRDTYQSHTLDFSNTLLTGIAEVDAGDGNDVITTSELSSPMTYRGNKGNDTFHTGSADVTLLYDGTSEGYDTFATNGSGTSVALAESDGTVIGVNGFANGVEEISGGGHADVVVRDTYQSHTLDFSNTLLTDIAEVDAGDGNDTITTSDLTAAMSYRGGAGNDTIHTGSTDVTLLYDGTAEGYDAFTNGSGNSVALAESDGTVIGVNGYANGVDTISAGGFADVAIEDTYQSHTLDFWTTTLDGIATVDGGNGNDTIRTALTANTTGTPLYDGGAGTDTLRIVLTLAQAQNAGVIAQIDAFNAGLPAPQSPSAPFAFTTLGFEAINFESVGTDVAIGTFIAPYDNVIVGTGGNDTITPGLVSGGVTGNPPPTGARDLIIGNNYNDTIDGGGGNDIIIGGHGNDAIDGGAGDDFYVYSGTNTGSDSFANNGAVDGTDTAVATQDGTVIGLSGSFVNGVDVIDAGGNANVTVSGTGGNDTLDFSGVTFQNLGAGFEVNGNNYNDVITTSDNTSIAYRGAHGEDTFNISAVMAATFLYSGTNNGSDTFSGNVAGDGVVNTAMAESDGTVIGLANGFANGVDVIDVGGFADVTVMGTGNSDTLDFSSVTFANVGAGFEVNGNNYNDVITTSDNTSVAYRGAHGEDTFNISAVAAATFLYAGTNNGLDTFSGNVAGDGVVNTAVAESDGTVIGLAGGFANGVDVIDVGGFADVTVMGTGNSDTLDFSEVTFANVGAGFEVNGNNFNDVITTSDNTSVAYRGAHGEDTFNISATTAATFLYSGTNNGFDTFSGNVAGDGVVNTAMAESNGTVIGLAGGFANGVDVIDVGGFADVTVMGTGNSDTLDFSAVTFANVGAGFEVNGNNFNDEITTSDNTAVAYRGAHGNDTFHIGDADATFLYSGTNNGSDSFDGNGAETATIVAEADGTVIGLNNGFANGVDIIDGGNFANVRVQGTGNSDTFDFSAVTFQNIGAGFEVNGANFNDVITMSNLSSVAYRGAHGNDTFVFTTSAADASIVDFNGIGNDVVNLTTFATDLATLQANASEVSGDVVLDLTTLGGAGDLTLKGVTLAGLDFTTNGSDFLV